MSVYFFAGEAVRDPVHQQGRTEDASGAQDDTRNEQCCQDSPREGAGFRLTRLCFRPGHCRYERTRQTLIGHKSTEHAREGECHDKGIHGHSCAQDVGQGQLSEQAKHAREPRPNRRRHERAQK